MSARATQFDRRGDREPAAVCVPHTVTMSDVDALQINYMTYFRWMDDGFTALMRLLGHPFSEILADGHAAPIVNAACSYLEPVGIDDVVEGIARIARVGSSSFVVGHRFERAHQTVAEGNITHVWVESGTSLRALPVPQWLRDAL